MKQFIYCVRQQAWSAAEVEPVLVVTSFGQLVRWCPSLLRVLGTKEFCKFTIKLLRGDKAIYFYQQAGQIQSYGIITFGYCKLYQVDNTDAVIGPVNTLASFQGKGLATKTLKAAVHWLFTERQCQAVYIDTSELNHPMQQVIRKSGFPEAIGYFTR